MNYFGDLDYGDIQQYAVQRKFLNDMLRLVRFHIFPWTEFDLDAEAIHQHVAHPSIFGLVSAIYEYTRKQTPKTTWGCKSTFMIEHIPSILKIHPKARFIFLVRDPRDVALSSKSSVFSPCHPLLSASLWNTQQRIGLDAQNAHPELFHLMKYEHLLQDNQKCLEELCAFLGITLEPQMFSFFQQKEARTGAALSDSWKNIGKPLKKNNFGKWKSKLSEAEVLDIESQCFSTMEELGYEPSHPKKLHTAPHRMWRAQTKELFLKTRIEYQSLRKDQNVLSRWRRDLFTQYLHARYGTKNR